MSTALPTRATRTLAIVAAFSVAGLSVSTAATAAPTVKSVAVKNTQFPRLIDAPGNDADVIRFVNVPGASWKIDDKEVAFSSGKTTQDTVVTAASVVTLEAVTGDPDTAWTLPTGTPSSWAFPSPTNAPVPAIPATSIKATWNDVPGAKDSVTLTKVTGVVWTVTTGDKTATYDASAFGSKTELTIPVTGTSTVVATKQPGYTLDGAVPTFTNALTEAATVTLPATLNTRVSAGDNPKDSQKGYGPGATTESVKIEGLPGVAWKVGSSTKAVSVKGTAYLPVDPDDMKAGKLSVEAEALKGYELPAGYVAAQVDFTDGDSATKTVTDADVTATDLGGTAMDALRLKGDRAFVWWVGQEVKQKTGPAKIVYKAVKAGKDGYAVYKPRFAKADTSTKVYVKPVANRGYELDETELTTRAYAFASDTTTVPAGNLGVVNGTKITFAPAVGVLSWTVTYTVKVGAKTSKKTLTVKTADVDATGATSMMTDFGTDSAPTVTAKLAKGHKMAAPATP